MFSHYQTLATLRKHNPRPDQRRLQVLLADDAAGVVAYGRKTDQPGRGGDHQPQRLRPQTGAIPVAGYLPDGVVL